MKNLIWHLLQFILICFLFSCKKENIFNENSNQTLSKSDITYLETKYPGLKILPSDQGAKVGEGFYNLKSTERLLDSLKVVLNNSFKHSNVKLKVKKNLNIDSRFPGQLIAVGDESSPGGGCGYGNYTASLSSGGMFSSFNFGFTYGGSGVSNAGLLTQGLTIGWWWNTGTTFYNGLSGTTYGAASYFYGLVILNYNFILNWSFDPINCSLYYDWTPRP